MRTTTMKTLMLTACLFCLQVSMFSQQVAKSIPYPSSPDGLIGFLQFTPGDYGTQKHPLIVFLHGIGERGNGTSQLYNITSNAIPKYCAAGASMRFTVGGQTSSFVVLSPQLSTQYGYWPTFYIKEMIKYARANLQIDTNRIYITGLSLGGGGIWRVITDTYNFDHTFDASIAAAAPVCGTQEMNDYDFASTIGTNHLPVWAFHSMDDGVVGVGATQHAEILGNILGVNSPAIKFTYYQYGNHVGAWVNAYDTGHITTTVNGGGSFTANPNLYEWFLSNTRAVNTVPVASAGTVQSITLPANSVNLSGSGTGTNGATIASYSWTKTSGPAGASIGNASAANTTVNGLSQGVYMFTLTVTDNHGLSATSSVTITVVAAPVAIAGPSQTISSTSTLLDAAASYSPNGIITSYSWQQVSGPAAATIVNANSPTPLVSNMVIGSSYAFQLTITDVAGASGSAVTGVTVMSATLPVEFVYFKGQKSNSGNLLQWRTATEQNNDYFSIERSEDGTHFVGIGRVAGSGNSSMPHDYTYSDSKTSAGNYYYRLKQVDKDGKSDFSKTILLSENAKGGLVQLYPNPVQASLAIAINNDSRGNGRIAVYDVTGRNVKEETVIKNDKTLNTILNMSNLIPGLYMVEIKIGNTYKLSKSILKK
ncbi:MAG: T9SS type A sorting domain-containing protein [Chitinophagaceae bacterium]